MRFVLIIFIILHSAFLIKAQEESKTYSETRKLLMQMERPSADKYLAKLFEEADARMPDLVQALDDADQKVRLNSQYVITYFADPAGLNAVELWQKSQPGAFAIANVNFLKEKIYLEGNESNLTKLVRKNIGLFQIARLSEKDISVELVAYNKGHQTALLEIVQGNVFTEGWHAVLRYEDKRWRLVSDTLRWQH